MAGQVGGRSTLLVAIAIFVVHLRPVADIRWNPWIPAQDPFAKYLLGPAPEGSDLWHSL
jgi:hypothetical protein